MQTIDHGCLCTGTKDLQNVVYVRCQINDHLQKKTPLGGKDRIHASVHCIESGQLNLNHIRSDA